MRLKRSFLTLVSLILSIYVIKADKLSDANIVGHVVEYGTGEHLPGFTIHLAGTAYGAHTDASGHYSITNIPVGTYTIEARC
ncbi:MAG: carboxypeptidase-like regulatory domain-containing protein, partial [Muribaculaceae bacterium]|nr:carboxypeptidase-like regulatory domain-containing protein [Muribaculaceae bacterium]